MGWFYRHFKLNRQETQVSLDIPLIAPALSDANGNLARRYSVKSGEFDLATGASPTAETVAYVPSSASIIRASCIITAGFTSAAGSKIEIGDGTTAGKFGSCSLTGTIDAGTVIPVTLTGDALGAGGKFVITPTKASSGTGGKVVVTIEYMM